MRNKILIFGFLQFVIIWISCNSNDTTIIGQWEQNMSISDTHALSNNNLLKEFYFFEDSFYVVERYNKKEELKNQYFGTYEYLKNGKFLLKQIEITDLNLNFRNTKEIGFKYFNKRKKIEFHAISEKNTLIIYKQDSIIVTLKRMD